MASVQAGSEDYEIIYYSFTLRRTPDVTSLINVLHELGKYMYALMSDVTSGVLKRELVINQEPAIWVPKRNSSFLSRIFPIVDLLGEPIGYSSLALRMLLSIFTDCLLELH